MIISAINIWKKYGVTMNHGSGNYELFGHEGTIMPKHVIESQHLRK